MTCQNQSCVRRSEGIAPLRDGVIIPDRRDLPDPTPPPEAGPEPFGEELPVTERVSPPEPLVEEAPEMPSVCQPGQVQACYTGPATTRSKGVCRDGQRQCVQGNWADKCLGEVLPSAEVCDAKDNNCDGQIDEGCECKPKDARSCYNGPANTLGKGVCKAGSQACDATGRWGACVGESKPQAEVCDGKDNDCDGKIDDNPIGSNAACKTGKQGLCQEGRTVCTSGRSSCKQILQASPEVCDGKDNDCDGKIDDNPTDVGKSCVVPNAKGPCARGTSTCLAGKLTCRSAIVPTTPVCPGVGDLDCDGMLDCEVPIPAGSYIRGAPSTDTHADQNERPQHQVTLTHKMTVWKNKITQGEYQTVLQNNPSRFKRCGTNCPVEMVSWHDALAFANALSTLQGLTTCYDCKTVNGKLSCDAKAVYQMNKSQDLYKCPGFRLPTDAEWEYLARAGTTAPLYTGKSPARWSITACRSDSNVDVVAWYCANSAVTYQGCIRTASSSPCLGPSIVGQKAPNPWKVYGMLGNLREWVYDDAFPYGSTSLTDPIQPATKAGRVVRGGSFGSPADRCRVSNRRLQDTAEAQYYIGFRVVRTIP